MFRAIGRPWRILVIVAAALGLAAGAAHAQSTTTHVKSFQIISVEGNDVVVMEADGPHEYTLPADFRFDVGGKQVPLQDLKPGMKGKATITTTTTVKPVFVTEVKDGVVMKNIGAGTRHRPHQGHHQDVLAGRDRQEGSPGLQGGPAGPAVGPARGRQAHRDDHHRGQAPGHDREAGAGHDRRGSRSPARRSPAAAAPQAAAPGATAAPAAEPGAAPPAAAPAATAAPATTPETTASAPAATTAPASTEPAEAGSSWLIWVALIVVIVIVIWFLSRRSGN